MQMSDSSRQIVYEVRLACAGRDFWLGGGMLLVACVAGDVYTFLERDYVPLVFLGLGTTYSAYVTSRGWRLWRNPGVYRISIDDQGMYVHSDDPKVIPSFTITATDIQRLIWKTIPGSDGPDTYEYYVETKSGARHRIGNRFTDQHLDGLKVLDRITDRFYWLGIHKEIK